MNQSKYNALINEGYSGSLNQMFYSFLRDLGFTQPTLNEREVAWLQSLGATSSNLNMAWRQMLVLNSFTGPRSEAEKKFWDSYVGGGPVLPSDGLLAENGDYLLTEDGDYLIWE